MIAMKPLILLFLISINTINIVESRSLFTALIENLFSTSRKDAVNHTAVYGHLDPPERSRLSLPRVWLTISATVDVEHNSTDYHNTSVVRAVEIHWQSKHYGPSIGDCIEIYDLNRNQPQSQPLRRYVLRDNRHRQLSNYIKTDIEFPYLNETEMDSRIDDKMPLPFVTKHGNISGKCLHFYAVYLSNNNKTESLYCIRLHPRWMENDYHLISNRSLKELMIPGSHDSSSYLSYDLNNYEGNVLTRFQYTQDESIYSQLAYGIRYLDMRVGSYNITTGRLNTSNTNKNATTNELSMEQLWMVHDIHRNSINLSQALDQIRRFVRRTTHEIIIVDFHRFVNGFESYYDFQSIDQRLRHFYTMIVKFLGPYIVPFSQNHDASIDDLIKLNRRIIVGYAYKFDPRGYFDSDLFWPAIEHQWAQTDKLGTLKGFINREICARRMANKSRGHLRSMMAELTPNFDGILFGRYHGLRDLASLVNSHYDLWFRRKYWTCSNIVSGDFILNSDIIQIAIDVNRRRFQPKVSSKLYDHSQLILK